MTTPSIAAGAATDPGRRRTVNEDSFRCEPPLFLVADGMGGHDAGDRASAAVIHAFDPLRRRADLGPEDVVEAVRTAHREVALIAAGTRKGAGSTLTGVVVVRCESGPQWLVVNVGDSRVYRMLGGVLEQLTVDHSLVQEMVDAGTLSREDMAAATGRNVITRAMGAAGSEPDYWLLPVVTGERILVVSDGLYTEVPDRQIADRLRLGLDASTTARGLVADAVAAGGRDNVTVLVLDVLAGGVDPAQLGEQPRPLVEDDEPDEDTFVPDTDTMPTAQGGRR